MTQIKLLSLFFDWEFEFILINMTYLFVTEDLHPNNSTITVLLCCRAFMFTAFPSAFRFSCEYPSFLIDGTVIPS